MLASNLIMQNGVLYTPDGRPAFYTADAIYGFVTLAASGEVVAAVASRKIRVLAVLLGSLIATNVKFQSAATDISLTMPLGINGGFVLPWSAAGWFETVAGEALNLNMTVATTVGVQVVYALVP